MDAIRFIEDEHAHLDRLFQQLQRSTSNGEGAGERQRALARELVRALSIHAAIEEQYLYPALRETGAEGEVLDALEEHHAAKVISAEIEAGVAGRLGSGFSTRFKSKVRLLATAVREHVKFEETELLPRLRRAFDEERLRALGDSLAAAREVAPTRPHPMAPDEPPGVFVAAALAAPWDRGRDALAGAAAVAGDVVRRAFRGGAAGARKLAESARRSGEESARDMAKKTREAASRTRQAVKGSMEDAREKGERVVDELRTRTESAAREVRAGAEGAAREVRTGSKRTKDAAVGGRARKTPRKAAQKGSRRKTRTTRSARARRT